MTYELIKSDGTLLTELNDGLVDNSVSSIKFIGRNVINYGAIQNENFLYLLENFANNIAPNAAQAGQLWFDTGVGKLKFYDNTYWHSLTSTAYGTTATNQTVGDLWFNTTTQQLNIKTATSYVAIGATTTVPGADLAEKYLADQEYEVGTVMVVGGTKEVTASTYGLRAIGVISANPGYMMNSDLEGGTYIALKGRVPVKIHGIIKKGDRLVATDAGRATKAMRTTFDIFAVALEDSNGKTVIEAIIL